MTQADLKAIMFQHLGIPYIYGGKNVLVGEDCSGLVCEFLKMLGAIGTNEEFGSQQLYDKFKPVSKSSQPSYGALAFYGKGPKEIDHVAMFMDDWYIVEAGHGTADTTSKQIAADRGAYSRVRPYQYRSDLVDIVNIDLGLKP